MLIQSDARESWHRSSSDLDARKVAVLIRMQERGGGPGGADPDAREKWRTWPERDGGPGGVLNLNFVSILFFGCVFAASKSSFLVYFLQ